MHKEQNIKCQPFDSIINERRFSVADFRYFLCDGKLVDSTKFC